VHDPSDQNIPHRRQLKVLMETLDALQLNASEPLGLQRADRDTQDQDLLDQPPSNWEVKVLIRRVISLTSEAAVQVLYVAPI
jgi:hypothetical protein